MAKKRKNKIPKLSDKDYNEYVMSLKEERPIKVIVKKDD